MRSNFLAIGLLLAGTVVVSSFEAGFSYAAEKAGVAAAVRNDVEGIQGGSSRALATGSSIFELETIRTGAASIAQLLFLDQTSLSVGPQSDVKLDRFVYDPSRSTGDVVLSATKGAFRFVSGTQNPLSYKINTPSATIGVRGTILNFLQTASGALTIVADEGKAVIDAGGVQITLNAGETLTIGPDGKITGPYQHDGVFERIFANVPWPLYGGGLPTENWQTEVPDDSTVRLEDLFDREIIDDDNEFPDGQCGALACDCYPDGC